MRRRVLERMAWVGLGLLLFCVLPGSARGQDLSVFAEDPLAKALSQNDVYVGKTLRNRVDTKALQLLTTPDPRFGHLKIVVVSQLPDTGKQFGTRDAYTSALHRYLHMDRDILLVVTGKGVSVSSNALPSDQITRIVQQ